MTLKDYLNFFRWKNVLMILVIFCLFKLVLFEKYSLLVALDYMHFSLLALSTAFIAIAGYIINDINDVKADIINKPEKLYVDKKITRIQAQYLFLGFNSLGLILGMYLSYYVGNTSYFAIYLLTSLLLYMYAITLKKKLLIGNILVSVIVFFCIVMTIVLDIIPTTNGYNLEAQKPIIEIVLLFGVFGFGLTFLREVVKDMEDIEGDKAIEANSLPISLGMQKTKFLLMLISIAMLSALVFIAYDILGEHLKTSVYLTALVCLPLCFFMFKLSRAKTKQDFHLLSGLLKLIMFLGILATFFI